MKKKSKKYYGMTGSQIGILIGTGVVGLLIVCVIFAFLLIPPSSQAQQTATDVPTATEPPKIVITLEPPTPTALEIATSFPPPDGWVSFQTQGATIWLPDNFIGGDMTDDRAVTINKVSRLGLHFRPSREAMRAASGQVVMWMIDKTQKASPIITTLLVSHELKDEGTTIDQYAQDAIKGSVPAQSTTIFENNHRTLLGRETLRIAYEQQIKASYRVSGVVYYIKDGNDFWTLDFNMDPNEYVNMQPIMDQSAKTFNLIQ